MTGLDSVARRCASNLDMTRSISADKQGDKCRAMSMMVVVGSHNGTEVKGARLVERKAKVAAAAMIWARAVL